MNFPKQKRTSSNVVGSNTNRQKHQKLNCNAAASYSITDAEVEEFYTIVKRINEISQHINGVTVDAVKKTEEAQKSRWEPAFVREDFDGGVKEGGGVSGRNMGSEVTVTVRGLGLDLNAEPEPDDGDCTATCASLRV